MLVDAKQLRWWGIDMRPRGRRRAAVTATYAAFWVAVWVHPPRTYQVLMVLFYASLFSPLWPAIEEATSVSTRRVFAGVALLVAIGFVIARPLKSDPIPVGLYAVLVLTMSSVVGWGKLVEMRGRDWLGKAVNQGEPLNRWKQRRLARLGFAIGLDGFAWYEYGVWFKRLTEKQSVEIEQMRRANPRGKWMRNRTSVLFDDERMRHEDDRVRARVQRVMSVVLMVSAIVLYWVAATEWRPRMETMVAWAWTLAALAVTLRQAIVLWTEEDPRAVTDEMELVQEA